MSEIIDVRGFPCPRPVISTKKALDEMQEGTITVVVDNLESKENVFRFAQSQGCQIEIDERGGSFYLEITKGHSTYTKEEVVAGEGSKKAISPDVVCISSDQFGTGDDRLGEILMKAFLNTLWDYESLPIKILFLNSGVTLTIEGSEVLEALDLLQKEGVEILSCGTCLDYYGIKDKLCVGRVTNMYETVVSLMTADKVIHI